MRLERYKIKLLFIDYLLLVASLYLSAIFQSFIKEAVFKVETNIAIIEFIYFSFTSLFIVITFQINNLYKIHIFISKAQQLVRIIKSLIYGAILLVLVSFLFKVSLIFDSRLFVVVFTILSIFLVSFTRIFILRPIFLRKRSIYNRKILLIGPQENAIIVASKFFVDNKLGAELVGYLDDNNEKFDSFLFSKIKCLGKIDDLENVVEANNVDEVIISIDRRDPERLLNLIDRINKLGLSVKLASDLFNIVSEKIEVENYYGIKLINSTPRMDENLSLYFKRIFDFTAALIGVIILSPLFLLIALLIKLTSKGPVLFKQMRIGKNGKPFIFYKFRSMTVIHGEDEVREKMMLDFMKNGKYGKMNKVINENRVTSIGKIIRKTSLDELPQLFNVIKGDMSLVGPRPCLPYEYENYEDWQKRRFNVYPGCTGVWQVYGRGKVSFLDSIILDIFYVNNMSPWLDLELIIRTIPVMIFGRGGK